MKNLIKVDGYPDLMRDQDTGMIISINKHKSSHYKNVREQMKRERQELEQLKSDVSEIKSLLTKLLENANNA